MEAFHHFNHNMTVFTGVLGVGLLIFSIAIFIGACILEIRLAKEKEWWKGLILPVLILIIPSIGNVLAVVLLVIYAVMRYRGRKDREMEQMKIKDL